MSLIHPTAVIHPRAQLDPTVRVGPYAVIDEHVTLGAECEVGPHVYLTGHTVIGARNRFHAGCVVGDAPQDLKYKGAPTRLRLGDGNVIREHATIHRSATDEGETVVGSNNFIMAGAHGGHNSRVGDHVILANGVLLGGYVEVGDRAMIGGGAAIHQFCRMGTLVVLQGLRPITKDLPPYTMAISFNTLSGLNVVGLRRAGFTDDQRLEIKRLYHLLFRSGLNV
ncbi:MAG: acyl-ACP--UDP-N-acetylglucosamine O-acyltransferase, partial [Rhodobacteraceae bacterium]|nr:acyl-ACP--UDP-N-acetylglucosamine O-acyltransferase [Paracoccaceae bacterium]